ncbi:hypothetical protein RB195_011408 [Necator americanus]|uniref:Uncharacterized protein n=1 Tax=Necator americanus TaxID=51031 RepID=A0ABR1D377_NECAM
MESTVVSAGEWASLVLDCLLVDAADAEGFGVATDFIRKNVLFHALFSGALRLFLWFPYLVNFLITAFKAAVYENWLHVTFSCFESKQELHAIRSIW